MCLCDSTPILAVYLLEKNLHVIAILFVSGHASKTISRTPGEHFLEDLVLGHFFQCAEHELKLCGPGAPHVGIDGSRVIPRLKALCVS